MTLAQLRDKFHQAIHWNAVFYFVYKAFSTFTTFLLYNAMTSQDFASWANINSIIFLLLLWLDFGLRKSLPRYYHLIAATKQQYQRFILAIILFQCSILIVTALCLAFLPANITTFLYISSNRSYASLASLLFIVEGLISLLRLIYHAHFHNKTFTIINTGILLAELALTILFIYTLPPSELLPALLQTKIITGLCIIILAGKYLPPFYATTIHSTHALEKSFIHHSFMMWWSTNIKSLSERNFMIPFLTHTLGPVPANIFKVANDMALLFYRSTIKTIGINDTSFLAQLSSLANAKDVFSQGFEHLSTIMSTVCTIALIGTGIICLTSSAIINNSLAIQTLLIILIGYVIEARLSPFERILEVHGNYRNLFVSYLPYSIGIIAILIWHQYVVDLGLLRLLILIHGLRALGSALMTYYASKKYNLELPIKELSIIIGLFLTIYGACYVCI